MYICLYIYMYICTTHCDITAHGRKPYPPIPHKSQPPYPTCHKHTHTHIRQHVTHTNRLPTTTKACHNSTPHRCYYTPQRIFPTFSPTVPIIGPLSDPPNAAVRRRSPLRPRSECCHTPRFKGAGLRAWGTNRGFQSAASMWVVP